MLEEELYSRRKWIERPRRCWQKQFIDGFLTELAAERFSKSTLRTHGCRLLLFGEYMARHGVTEITQVPQWIDSFVTQVGGQNKHRSKPRSLLARFIRHLERKEIIPAPTPVPLSPDEALVEDYIGFLRDQRGLCRGTIELKRTQCQALMAYLVTEGVGHLRALRPE